MASVETSTEEVLIILGFVALLVSVIAYVKSRDQHSAMQDGTYGST